MHQGVQGVIDGVRHHIRGLQCSSCPACSRNSRCERDFQTLGEDCIRGREVVHGITDELPSVQEQYKRPELSSTSYEQRRQASRCKSRQQKSRACGQVPRHPVTSVTSPSRAGLFQSTIGDFGCALEFLSRETAVGGTPWRGRTRGFMPSWGFPLLFKEIYFE